ncbi:MAG: sulfatase-like hydrolase/transferase, partial [Alphaproteobacteria bacterium]|nr:sulfatase-like hydrolase/transferase [Alphaproteobacteria bacterium]
YDPGDIELPDNFDVSATPFQAGLKKRLAEGKAYREGHATFAVTGREAKEIIALTYGMIAMIDDCVGQVMDALKRLGFDENTIVIFTSDHGDHMGDHGIMLKSSMHTQGLTRVPFVWRDPGIAQETDSTLASTIDIAPTILRRAGIQPNNGVQGRDLLDSGLAPDSLLVEVDNPFPHGPRNPRTRTLVTEDWRYTIHQGFDWGELYDLVNDPGETKNLWADDAHKAKRAELTEKLLRRMMEMQENSPLQTRLS